MLFPLTRLQNLFLLVCGLLYFRQIFVTFCCSYDTATNYMAGYSLAAGSNGLSVIGYFPWCSVNERYSGLKISCTSFIVFMTRSATWRSGTARK